MRKIILLIFLSLSIINAEYTLEKDESYLVMKGTNLKDIIFFKKFTNSPYTGKGVYIDEVNGQLVKVTTIKGKPHGKLFIYSVKTGAIQRILTYNHGKLLK